MNSKPPSRRKPLPPTSRLLAGALRPLEAYTEMPRPTAAQLLSRPGASASALAALVELTQNMEVAFSTAQALILAVQLNRHKALNFSVLRAQLDADEGLSVSLTVGRRKTNNVQQYELLSLEASEWLRPQSEDVILSEDEFRFVRAELLAHLQNKLSDLAHDFSLSDKKAYLYDWVVIDAPLGLASICSVEDRLNEALANFAAAGYDIAQIEKMKLELAATGLDI